MGDIKTVEQESFFNNQNIFLDIIGGNRVHCGEKWGIVG
jgi:hypothetical protein